MVHYASPPLSVRDWSFVFSADPGLISDGLAVGASPATLEIYSEAAAYCQYWNRTLHSGLLAWSDGHVQKKLIACNCIARILMISDYNTDRLQMVFGQD